MDRFAQPVHSPRLSDAAARATPHSWHGKRPVINVMEILRRAVLGGGIPTTESVQRHILTILEGHGSVHSADLPGLMTLSVSPDSARSVIDQAAQILVNRGEVRAHQNGVPIDPVAVSTPYTLALTAARQEVIG